MKDFISIIEYTGRKHGVVGAFNDFLTFAVCALSMGAKEEEYLKIAEKYTSEEMTNFSQAFALMVHEMDNHGEGLKDCLGDYFMEVQGSNWHGQFFTPQPLCDMMGQLAGNNYKDGDKVNDCACGSGRMLLSVAKQNRKCVFYASDIDYQCCQMTLINFCLNGLTGYVSHMNTLSLEVWKNWGVGIHPIHLVPYIFEINFTEKEKVINQTMLDFYELEKKQETKEVVQVETMVENKYSHLLDEIDLLL